jgi:hypothetical protein
MICEDVHVKPAKMMKHTEESRVISEKPMIFS